jgi:hypothetical protein
LITLHYSLMDEKRIWKKSFTFFLKKVGQCSWVSVLP